MSDSTSEKEIKYLRAQAIASHHDFLRRRSRLRFGLWLGLVVGTILTVGSFLLGWQTVGAIFLAIALTDALRTVRELREMKKGGE